MANPVLVEVTRGDLVESRHRGMVVAVDGDGKVVFSQGEIEGAVFPRSACKAMQGLPLVESGAADAYGFGNRELALACSSHSGEPEHASLAGAMLAAWRAPDRKERAAATQRWAETTYALDVVAGRLGDLLEDRVRAHRAHRARRARRGRSGR